MRIKKEIKLEGYSSEYENTDDESNFRRYFPTDYEYSEWIMKKEKDREVELFERREEYINRKNRERIAKQLQKKESLKTMKKEMFGSSSSSDTSSSGSEAEDEPIPEETVAVPDIKMPKVSSPQRNLVETKEQLLDAQVKRSLLEKIVHKPFFKDVVKGAVVMINVGKTKELQSEIILCEVINVLRSGKVYDFGTTKTDKTLHIRYGSFEYNYRLKFVSNRECPTALFEEYRQRALETNTLLSLDDVLAKKKQISETLRRSLTDNEITAEINEKKRFGQTSQPKQCMEKARLNNQLLEAQSAKIKDHKKINAIKRKIQEYELRQIRAEEQEKIEQNSTILSSIISKYKPYKKTSGHPSDFERKLNDKNSPEFTPFTRKKLRPQVIAGSKLRTRPADENDQQSPRKEESERSESTPKRIRIEDGNQYFEIYRNLDMESHFPVKN